MAKFALRSSRVVLPDRIADTAVLVDGERIVGIVDVPPADFPIVDLGEAALLPGLVDSHAHLNEPGRTEWEGFATATQAAAAGGITTVVDMPLNCIPVTTSLQALKIKQQAVAEHAWIDYGFWGGVVPGNASEYAAMAEHGALGFKCFLTHSGIDDFPASTEHDLRKAMPVLAEIGVPLLVHAELESPCALPEGADPRAYATFLASRPPQWESDALALVADLQQQFRGPVHIVHLSAADALAAAETVRRLGLPLSIETCPHYLTFIAEEIPDGRTEFKCAPPIRERANRERLWQGLRDGAIDFIVSDHSPCTPALKLLETGDFMGAWGGIASLQFGLSILWTHARRRGFGLLDIARWTSERPAKLAGLADKGGIAVGKHADFTVFHPEQPQTISAERILHRHKLTPYLGQLLDGVVARTLLRGRTIFQDGAILGPAQGQMQRRR